MKHKFFAVLAILMIALTLFFWVWRSPVRSDATAFPRTESHAIAAETRTPLSTALQPQMKIHAGQSGFFLFEKGDQSFMARLALVRLAQKSVDLEYYAIADDVTSNLMVEALIRAAARGVKVRLLIDNLTVSHLKDALAAFQGIPNIEIRVFNPTVTRAQSLPSKIKTYLTGFRQIDKRMHNKAIISDNVIAIMGGRNISDEYFDAGDTVAFRDIDVMATGPVVPQISKSFDLYWNDRNAFPIDSIYKADNSYSSVEKLRQDLKDNWETELKKSERRQYSLATIPKLLGSPDMKLTWGEAAIAADNPSKIEKPVTVTNSKPLNAILSLLTQGHKEFIIISAYFVPEDAGVDWLAKLKQKGMDIQILTNSLASTDVVAVHSGYAPYREALLKDGIKLYELMPVDHKKHGQRVLGIAQPPRAGLHTKVYIIDGKDTVIGSLNLDPRSVQLNTEMAIVIHSTDLASQMKNLFNRAASPEFSYKVSLASQGSASEGLQWQGREKGKDVTFHHDPHAGILRTVENFIFSFLPVENQL